MGAQMVSIDRGLLDKVYLPEKGGNRRGGWMTRKAGHVNSRIWS